MHEADARGTVQSFEESSSPVPGREAQKRIVPLLLGAAVSVSVCCATPTPEVSVPEEMALIPAGHFMMGSPPEEGAPDQHPRQRVYVDAFYMDRYEVTVGRYRKFIEATGHRPPPDWVSEYSPGDEYPVVGVSWDDAAEYARWAGKRLPTEAEWEYACRAGTTTKYNGGDVMSPDDANYVGVGGKDRWTRTSPVGSFAPNAWGLYDMHGNVFEFCQDWYDPDYYEKSPTRNPKGPLSGKCRVIRGGSWISDAFFRGSASRLSGPPGIISHNVGFRCVRDFRR